MNKLRTKKGGMAMSPERAFQLGKTETLNEVMKIIDDKIKYLNDYKGAGFYKEASLRIKELMEIKVKLLELEGKK